MSQWYKLSTDEVLQSLASCRDGLTVAEAAERLARYGTNELTEKKRRTSLMMFLGQFNDFLIIVLLAAAVMAGLAGSPKDAIVILTVVVLNAVIGFIQEHKAEKAMAALKKMAAPSATVIRGGETIQIGAAFLVPGDIVLLDAGRVVPADLRLLEAAQLQVEEAALTGESVAVEKYTDAILLEGSLPLGDRKNMTYNGTIVVGGRGIGVVVATGMETEIGKIATMLQDEEEVKTPLQKRLAQFAKKLAGVILLISGIVFTMGVLRGEDVVTMFLTGISLAVAAIPEALPAVITITLALGAKKMVRQNALVRKLAAVETLGSVTFICSDKTGTLTLNRMEVEVVYSGGTLVSDGEEINCKLLLQAMALSNDAQNSSGEKVLGDPTEVALYNFAGKHGFNKKELEQHYPRSGELPFDSERKAMTTFHRASDGQYLSFTKGAVEMLVEKCGMMLTADGQQSFDRAEVLQVASQMAASGLRVLALGMRHWSEQPENLQPAEVESNLILLGLVGIMDPPREEAKEAVAMCRTAGIVPVMITGDHPLTAEVIARRLGILSDESAAVVTGSELEKMSMTEFADRVEQIRVYARVAPEQKLKIVKALQEKNQFVAMTGDGVNDAPAIKRADIGIAMGITGTDVTKEASAIILLDDNFATIVKAVREGRRIYNNILKFIKYSMTANAGTIVAIFFAPLFGMPLPMLPIQILWLNMLTDSLPGLALAGEPAEKDVMHKPPRNPQEGVFASGRGLYIARFGLFVGCAALFLQAYASNGGMAWQTMVFTFLVLNRMGVALAVRSDYFSLWQMGLFSNKAIIAAVALVFILQLAAVYLPFFNYIFNTEPLSLEELGLVLLLSPITLLAVEAEKLYRRLRSASPSLIGN
ncbi:MAG: cation-translocating P-type ATPase [Firmicutes bacterium]|nr:cation-translocating P-type ATPase [Bacillota bacterium]MCL5992745.1 cation-translocating P-type ATPase [Bacillota bacterium]